MLFASLCRTERCLCHRRIAAGLLQLSVLRHVKHELSEVAESAECCCTNCLPSSTTPSSLSRPSSGSPWLPVRGRVDYKIAVLWYKVVKLQHPSYLTGPLLLYRQSRVLRSSTSYLLSTQSSVFIDKHGCSSVLMLRPHHLERSSFICTHCWQFH